VIGTFMGEAAAMLGEGIPAATVEQAALQAGYPTGPLALFDEVSLVLGHRIREASRQAAEAEGWEFPGHPSYPVIDKMVLEFERGGRAAGAGFYDYAEGKRVGLWSGLAETWGSDIDPRDIDLTELQERMLFVEAIDSVRCFDEGVLRNVPDANIGSIFGIGFPPWTGGVLQYINGYGLAEFVARAQELTAKFGDRFEPPASLVARAQSGEDYI
jgi:3-hydroxyacyl-CoA dehydrogenase/enoyl-CoA hydratase/3-hydroxybutyryl-CoA epimerase